MTKLITFCLLLIIACLLGGVYGVLHDQITYSISSEYYTKFKFYQFGMVEQGMEAHLHNPRMAVSMVGFLATWWMGLAIGIVLAFTGLIHTSWKVMFNTTLTAFLITLGVAFLTGLIGLCYGYLVLIDKPLTDFKNWFIPSNLHDVKHFIMVGSMHNFSYMGGLTGVFAGACYSVWKKMILTNQSFNHVLSSIFIVTKRKKFSPRLPHAGDDVKKSL